jgi:O-antigen ligase
MLLLATLAPAMALANRSAPMVLVLAALLAVASASSLGGWRALARILAPPRRSPLFLASSALFVVLAILSLGWSADRAQSLRALAEAGAPFLAGLVVFGLMPHLSPRWGARALAVGVIIAALICIVELNFGLPLRQALHLRAKAFEYNRPVLTLLALFWPLFAAAIASRREPLLWIALVMTTLAIWSSHSGTAMFAQLVSLVAVVIAWRLPRLALLAGGVGVALTFALIFAFGDIVWRVLPDAAYRALAWTHAADRVEIWQSFGAVMLHHPWLGVGFGTSPVLGDTAILAEVAEPFRRMLPVGHPHNGYLQIGVELGLAGCILALTAALSLLWSFRRLEGRALTARLGLFAVVAATMLVGHGAWQAWWIAVLFVAAACVRMLERGEPVDDAGDAAR